MRRETPDSWEQRNGACFCRVPLAVVSDGEGGGREAGEQKPPKLGVEGGQGQNMLRHQVKPHPCNQSRAEPGTRCLGMEVSLPVPVPQPQPLPLETQSPSTGT